jgi:Na+-driven multidrug efflux pump
VVEVALIYGLDQGIGASALATVLAQCGGAAVYVRRVSHAARRQGADLAPHPLLFTDDPEVLVLASFLLVWVAALQPVNAVAFVLDGVLIGAGDMRFLAGAMILAAAVFIPAALMVLALDAGIGWLWASLGLLMATRASALLARFASDRWIVLGTRR